LLLFLYSGESIHGKGAAELVSEGFKVIEDFSALVAEANRIVHPDAASRKAVHLVLSNCVVRSWRWDDAESLAKHANNRNVWRSLLDGFPSPYTIRNARQWLAHALSEPDPTTFAIEIDGEAAGGIGFNLKKGLEKHSAEIGYWIGESHWGRGIASEALSAVSGLVFEYFPGIWRLYAHVFDWNGASARVLEKAGYSYEGTLRQSAFKDGRIIDLKLYSRIASEQ